MILNNFFAIIITVAILFLRAILRDSFRTTLRRPCPLKNYTIMSSVAEKVPFEHLCKLLDKIEKKKGNNAKKEILQEFIDEWRKFHKQLHESKTVVLE